MIDSLISGCPIPQVYLNVINKGSKLSRKTIYDVVDGQQRLTTILDYVQDKWTLQAIKGQVYPVSEEYVKFEGRHYSDLPEQVQTRIWNYPIPVQELREWSESQIQALFRRLNIVNVRLTRQELRHSQFFGEYMKTVQRLAAKSFWEKIRIFSPNDYRRMIDVEYASELLTLVIDEVQEGQKKLDDFYRKYEDSFPGQKKFVKEFNAAIESLGTIRNYIEESRYRKKADFYALFAAVVFLNRKLRETIDLGSAQAPLMRLEKKLDADPISDVNALTYHRTVIEGPNKLKKRRSRTKILSRLIERAIK